MGTFYLCQLPLWVGIRLFWYELCCMRETSFPVWNQSGLCVKHQAWNRETSFPVWNQWGLCVKHQAWNYTRVMEAMVSVASKSFPNPKDLNFEEFPMERPIIMLVPCRVCLVAQLCTELTVYCPNAWFVLSIPARLQEHSCQLQVDHSKSQWLIIIEWSDSRRVDCDITSCIHHMTTLCITGIIGLSIKTTKDDFEILTGLTVEGLSVGY